MTAMGTLLISLGEVVTKVISIVGDVATEIVANPLLLIGVGLGLLGAGVALVKRFA